jgi:hypothetical protein
MHTVYTAYSIYSIHRLFPFVATHFGQREYANVPVQLSMSVMAQAISLVNEYTTSKAFV